MSAINRPILEIYPPVLMPITRKGETFDSAWHQCPYCNGTGTVYSGQKVYEHEYATCPVCEGEGKLRAKITILWEPMKDIEK